VQTAAEYRRTWSAELVEAERKANGLTDDVVKAAQRTRLQALTAPVAGTVQQLAVHTVGGVVTPAQSLLLIVPADSRLEIEAMVPNRDIGFVHAGQPAEIKVDTFNFTKYGLLHGEVLGVSQDAITRDKPPDRSREKWGRAARHQRAAGAGDDLRGAHLARPHPDAGGGPAGRSCAWHGGDGRDQDRDAPHHQLSAVAAHAIHAGEYARAVRPFHVADS
jgi:hemolysin D